MFNSQYFVVKKLYMRLNLLINRMKTINLLVRDALNEGGFKGLSAEALVALF